MTDAPDREAIIDAVTRERPWRTPSYLILFFLRRWAVVLFTLSFMLASRQHWTLVAVATLAALWFDLKVTPNALDLRLSDREFVRKIYDLEEFETESTEKHGKILKIIVIFILCFFLASVVGRMFLDYDTQFSMNKFVVEMATGGFAAFCIASTSSMYPIHGIPRPDWLDYGQATLEQWSKHGYDILLRDFTLPLWSFINFLVIFMTLICVTILPAKEHTTINDYVVFSYTALSSIAGFGVPIIMSINAKGQKVARHLLKKLEEEKASRRHIPGS
jgi:hypothetical protein